MQVKLSKPCQKIIVTLQLQWMAWTRSDHTLLYGIVAVNSIETGKVLDVHICSTYCHSCELSRKLTKDSEKYENWEASHNLECKVNYHGPSKLRKQYKKVKLTVVMANLFRVNTV